MAQQMDPAVSEPRDFVEMRNYLQRCGLTRCDEEIVQMLCRAEVNDIARLIEAAKEAARVLNKKEITAEVLMLAEKLEMKHCPVQKRRISEEDEEKLAAVINSEKLPEAKSGTSWMRLPALQNCLIQATYKSKMRLRAEDLAKKLEESKKRGLLPDADAALKMPRVASIEITSKPTNPTGSILHSADLDQMFNAPAVPTPMPVSAVSTAPFIPGQIPIQILQPNQAFRMPPGAQFPTAQAPHGISIQQQVIIPQVSQPGVSFAPVIQQQQQQPVSEGNALQSKISAGFDSLF